MTIRDLAQAGLAERLGDLLSRADHRGTPGTGGRHDPRLVDTVDARPTLASATMPIDPVDPVSLFAAAAEAGLEAALWLKPEEGFSLVGVGRAWSTEPAGPGRFTTAERAWRDLVARATLDRGDADAPAGPVLVGGLGFTGRAPEPSDTWAPFGAASLVLPGLTCASTPAGTWLTASIVDGSANGVAAHRLERLWTSLSARARELAPSPNGLVARPVFAPLETRARRPDRETWDRLVGMFAGAVGRGRLDKVVLARRVDLRAPVELDVVNALYRLAASAPESSIYGFRRDGRTFLGATPERLVRTEGRRFQTVAVAGTTRRGASPEEDASLAAALLASDKDREEQAIVMASIRDMLAPLAETLEVEPEPSIMRLRFVQHLVTRITGTLPDAHGLLALGGRLHPTPAVGGEPRELALALLDEHEGFDRGWYAGPIGWLGADGDGELCVALRCGIVERTEATLFAGCGIVADSDPAAEWEESRIKLRAVVSALGHLEHDGD
jgi:menaquinone-specific isochorismate synthase